MNITVSVPSNKPLHQAITDLKHALSTVNFSVLWELNFKDKMREKGLTLEEDFHILEVCNPVQAKKVLDQSIEVGFFLPCKMAVYTKGGQTYIGMPKPTEIMSLMGDELNSVAREVESVLLEAIEKAK